MIRVLTEIVIAATAIAGLWKGITAHAKADAAQATADANTKKSETISAHVFDLAVMTPPPSAPSPQTTTGTASGKPLFVQVATDHAAENEKGKS